MQNGVRLLAKKIEAKKATVAVVGLGYVGLPLVRALLEKGFRVWGVDVDRARIKMIKSGKPDIEIRGGDVAALVSESSFPGGVHPDEIAPFLKKKKLQLSTNFAPIPRCDVVVICTPTPLDEHHEPDLRYVKGPAKEIGKRMKRGTLVILESTSYPGTTRELLPFFESKRVLGKDFFLAFSPERIDPGNMKWKLENIPKIVSGIDVPSRELALVFYSQFIQTLHVASSTEVAEMAKLLENIFRLVNISLVNEITLLSDKMGINMWEVIEAAKTKPYGFMPFFPSAGAGGHCIPLDPLYLAWKAKEFNFYPRFIEHAAEINNVMPDFGVAKVTYVLNRISKSVRDAKILFIGATYKKDVADIRESSAVYILGKLLHKGARIEFHDPYLVSIEVGDPLKRDSYGAKTLKTVPLTEKLVKEQDCVVIAVDHTNVDYNLIAKHAKIVVDLRNVMQGRKTKGQVFHL